MSQSKGDNSSHSSGRDHAAISESAAVEQMRLSDAEELGNAITHGSGCVLAILVSAWVLYSVEFSSQARLLGFLAYAASLVLVFGASTLSHTVRQPQLLRRMRAWDQGAIYFMIAGTYTPGVIAYSQGWVCGGLLTAIWGLAAFGFYTKVIAEHKVNAVTTLTYVLLGWVPAMILGPGVPFAYFAWMLAGGLFYSAGVYFLINDAGVRFFHVVWHVLVLFAAGIHFYAIYSMTL